MKNSLDASEIRHALSCVLSIPTGPDHVKLIDLFDKSFFVSTLAYINPRRRRPAVATPASSTQHILTTTQ